MSRWERLLRWLLRRPRGPVRRCEGARDAPCPEPAVQLLIDVQRTRARWLCRSCLDDYRWHPRSY